MKSSRALPPLLAATIASMLACPTTARADGEGWEQLEYRLPIVSTERPTWPRVAFRVYAEAREAGRYSGLYDSFFRFGPLVWVTPFLFIGTHATFEGTRTAAGCTTGSIASCGQYVFEFRAELEPNFFGRIGPFTFNDRNRLEFRWRESGSRGRYRNQLRINYQPVGAVVFPWIMDEMLFDLKSEGFNQNRANVGIAIQIASNIRLDISYMLRSRFIAGTAAAPATWEHDHVGVVQLFVDVPALPAPSNTTHATHAASSAPPTSSAPPPTPSNSPAP